MVFNLSDNTRGLDFISKHERLAQKVQVNPNDGDINFEKFINSNDSSFEVFVFANYDICNFTRYKKNHRTGLSFYKNLFIMVLILLLNGLCSFGNLMETLSLIGRKSKA